MESLPKREIASTSLENNGSIIIVEDLQAGIEQVNLFAPEHFELMVAEPLKYLGEIKMPGLSLLGIILQNP